MRSQLSHYIPSIIVTIINTLVNHNALPYTIQQAWPTRWQRARCSTSRLWRCAGLISPLPEQWTGPCSSCRCWRPSYLERCRWQWLQNGRSSTQGKGNELAGHREIGWLEVFWKLLRFYFGKWCGNASFLNFPRFQHFGTWNPARRTANRHKTCLPNRNPRKQVLWLLAERVVKLTERCFSNPKCWDRGR